MIGLDTFGLTLLAATTASHLASIAAAAWAVSAKKPDSAIAGNPGITVLRPVCGLENNIQETLRSTFGTTYPGPVQLVFCVQRESDPIVPVVRQLIAEHPGIDAALLVGDERISGNPKLNNLVKGWAAAKYDYILMADSNVLLPPDYLQRLIARWTEDTGLVTSPPAGIRAENAWGQLEAAFLNTYQGRWQLSSDAMGNGYAQGKMLFWRRDILENAGGLAALGQDMAEDVASTKVVRAAGLKVRLLGDLLPQPIGRRALPEVWKRQVRWAKVRRMGFPALYSAELLTGLFVPLVLTIALIMAGVLPLWSLAGLFGLWFGAEYALARLAGWPADPRDVALWVLRDLMLPGIWAMAWVGNGFEWRGNAMDATDVTPQQRA